eukprot:3797083-Prorocentrum_lima.AAC.1
MPCLVAVAGCDAFMVINRACAPAQHAAYRWGPGAGWTLLWSTQSVTTPTRIDTRQRARTE